MDRTLGVIYIAFGYDFLVLSANSARTLRQCDSDVHIKIVTNIPFSSARVDGINLFDDIQFEEESTDNNRFSKINLFTHATHDYNLFLDSDTEVYQSPKCIIPCLRHYDAAMRMMPAVTRNHFSVSEYLTTEETPVSEWNTGVIFFNRNSTTQELFDLWKKYFQQLNWSRDQPAFVRAAFAAKRTRILPLPAGWNAKPVKDCDLGLMNASPHEVSILHYRDPCWVPRVARNIARTHEGLELDLTMPSEEVRIGAQHFAALAKAYRNRLYPMPGGKNLLRIIAPKTASLLWNEKGRLKSIDKGRRKGVKATKRG